MQNRPVRDALAALMVGLAPLAAACTHVPAASPVAPTAVHTATRTDTSPVAFTVIGSRDHPASVQAPVQVRLPAPDGSGTSIGWDPTGTMLLLVVSGSSTCPPAPRIARRTADQRVAVTVTDVAASSPVQRSCLGDSVPYTMRIAAPSGTVGSRPLTIDIEFTTVVLPAV